MCGFESPLTPGIGVGNTFVPETDDEDLSAMPTGVEATKDMTPSAKRVCTQDKTLDDTFYYIWETFLCKQLDIWVTLSLPVPTSVKLNKYAHRLADGPNKDKALLLAFVLKLIQAEKEEQPCPPDAAFCTLWREFLDKQLDLCESRMIKRELPLVPVPTSTKDITELAESLSSGACRDKVHLLAFLLDVIQNEKPRV